MMTVATAVPKRALAVRVRRISGEIHLAARGQVFQLTEVAAEIWSYIDGRRSISDIADLIVGEYDVPREEAVTDAAQLVDQLIEMGACEWASGNT